MRLRLAIALGLMGCGGPRPPAGQSPPLIDVPDAALATPDATPPAADAAPQGRSTYTIPVAPVIITRLTQGKGKGETLRYNLTAATGQIVDQTIDTTVELTVSGAPPQVQSAPTQNIGGTFEVVSADAESGALRITLDRASASDPTKTHDLAPLIGTTIEHTVDIRGRSKDLTVTARAPDIEAAKTMAGMIRTRSRTIPLPLEPIGVGGTWSVVADDEVNGIQSKVTTTYTLTARKGDQVTLTGILKSVSPAQTLISVDGTIELKSMVGTASIAATVDLRRPIPAATTTESYDAVMGINGQDVRVGSKIAARVTTRAR